MKMIWIPAILAATVAMDTAKCAAQPDPDLVIYLHSGNEAPSVIGPARKQAERILAAGGISVAWRTGNPNYHGRAEVIEAVLTRQPDSSVMPGALAFATLGQESGTRIEIFYNRIRASRGVEETVNVLAHVLVHEITHIVEGVKRHSETGIMKAHWDTYDYRRMRSYSLPFAGEDLHLIHDWVDRHNQVLLASVR